VKGDSEPPFGWFLSSWTTLGLNAERNIVLPLTVCSPLAPSGLTACTVNRFRMNSPPAAHLTQISAPMSRMMIHSSVSDLRFCRISI
jgi:hypothetical protein